MFYIIKIGVGVLMEKCRIAVVLSAVSFLFPLQTLAGSETVPTTINAPPRPLPVVKPSGDPRCSPYSQLPTAVFADFSPLSENTINNEAGLVVIYDDGRLSPLDNYIDCGRKEQIAASQYFPDSIRRDTIFSAVPSPHGGAPWNNTPDCAYRQYPVCSPFTGPTCSDCADPVTCGPDPGFCEPCEDQFEDNPPVGFPYTHTTMECAGPTVARNNFQWHVVFSRTNYESFGCSTSALLSGCNRRVRALPGLAVGSLLNASSMAGQGDIADIPFCGHRGCCLGTGFQSLTLVPDPDNWAMSAWVFATAILDEPGLSGVVRLNYNYSTLSFTGEYEWVNGLDSAGRLSDVTWSQITTGKGTQIYRFWGLTFAGWDKHLYVYFSDDEGLSWSPYVVNGEHLRYGDGERTWLGKWLRNWDGSLAAPVTVLWTHVFDHDGNPNTPEVETIFFETDGTTEDLPAPFLEWIFWDGFERGDSGAWFSEPPPS